MIYIDIRTSCYWYYISLTFTLLRKLTVYYALDVSCPTYDYDYTGNAPVYNGYVKGELASEGLTKEANARWGYYDNAYIYAS